MTYPPGWRAPPPSSSPSYRPDEIAAMNGSAVPYLLGRLVTQGEHTAAMLAETREDVRDIKGQLTHGHGVMSEHASRIRALEQRPEAAPAAAPQPASDAPSRFERLLLRWGTLAIWLGTLAATGSIETAGRVLAQVGLIPGLGK